MFRTLPGTLRTAVAVMLTMGQKSAIPSSCGFRLRRIRFYYVIGSVSRMRLSFPGWELAGFHPHIPGF